MLKSVGMLVLGVALIAGTGYYLYHIWSDCLADHSVITCMRMLGR